MVTKIRRPAKARPRKVVIRPHNQLLSDDSDHEVIPGNTRKIDQENFEQFSDNHDVFSEVSCIEDISVPAKTFQCTICSKYFDS